MKVMDRSCSRMCTGWLLAITLLGIESAAAEASHSSRQTLIVSPNGAKETRSPEFDYVVLNSCLVRTTWRARGHLPHQILADLDAKPVQSRNLLS